MLPLNRNERTPQNKLSGMRIAFGEASWGDVGDGTEGYVFAPNVGFKWEQDEGWLASEKGVDVDALLDCVEQVEEQLGGPDSTRDQYGIYRSSGHSYIGLTAQSRQDPRITLHFTPTSVDGSMVTAYFEWYLREGDMLPTDDAELEVEFARLAGVSLADDPEAVPTLPTWEDAAHALARMDLVEEGRREAFLDRIYRLEKTLGVGYRDAERAALLSEWTAMTALTERDMMRALNPDDDADPRPREVEGEYSLLISKMNNGQYSFSLRGPDGGTYDAPGGATVKAAIDAGVKQLKGDALEFVKDEQDGRLLCYVRDGDAVKKLKDVVVESLAEATGFKPGQKVTHHAHGKGVVVRDDERPDHVIAKFDKYKNSYRVTSGDGHLVHATSLKAVGK